MNKKFLSISIGLCLIAGSAVAKNNHLTLEQRMEQLEARLATAESRATIAETQMRELQNKQNASIQVAQNTVSVISQPLLRRVKRISLLLSLNYLALAT